MKKLYTILLAVVLATTALCAQNRIMFIVGSATHAEWGFKDMTALVLQSDGTYQGVVYLQAGTEADGPEFKFLVDDRNWEPAYVGEANHVSPDENGMVNLVYRPDYSVPDNKFIVKESQNYHITVDLENMTAKFVPAEYQEKPVNYCSIFMIGGCTPAGWHSNGWDDLDLLTILEQDFNKPLEYSVKEVLLNINEDEPDDCMFKFCNSHWAAGRFENDCFYFADPEDPSKVTDYTGVDSKWMVTEKGKYNVYLNLDKYTMRIVKSSEDTGEGGGDDDSVSNISVENGAVKYFNLNGVAVENPANGQLVIRIDGKGKATKVIF